LITRTWLKSIQDSFWDEFSKGVSFSTVERMDWRLRNRRLGEVIASFELESGIHLTPPQSLVETDLRHHVGAYWGALNSYMILAQKIMSDDEEQITISQVKKLGEAIMRVRHCQEMVQACLGRQAWNSPKKNHQRETE
jgi:hypothetical protein